MDITHLDPHDLTNPLDSKQVHIFDPVLAFAPVARMSTRRRPARIAWPMFVAAPRMRDRQMGGTSPIVTINR
jgi:hypothetical protein